MRKLNGKLQSPGHAPGPSDFRTFLHSTALLHCLAGSIDAYRQESGLKKAAAQRLRAPERWGRPPAVTGPPPPEGQDVSPVLTRSFAGFGDVMEPCPACSGRSSTALVARPASNTENKVGACTLMKSLFMYKTIYV